MKDFFKSVFSPLNKVIIMYLTIIPYIALWGIVEQKITNKDSNSTDFSIVKLSVPVYIIHIILFLAFI